jgi:type II secretory pathway component PulM
MTVKDLYEQDELEWAEENARLLRSGKLSEIDVEHIAEVLEDMSKRERRELRSRLVLLIMHLLKFQHQPDKRSASWEATIKEQRRQISYLMEDYPSLRKTTAESLADWYLEAARDASFETGLEQSVFPRRMPYTIEQLLDESWMP